MAKYRGSRVNRSRHPIEEELEREWIIPVNRSNRLTDAELLAARLKRYSPIYGKEVNFYKNNELGEAVLLSDYFYNYPVCATHCERIVRTLRQIENDLQVINVPDEKLSSESLTFMQHLMNLNNATYSRSIVENFAHALIAENRANYMNGLQVAMTHIANWISKKRALDRKEESNEAVDRILISDIRVHERVAQQASNKRTHQPSDQPRAPKKSRVGRIPYNVLRGMVKRGEKLTDEQMEWYKAGPMKKTGLLPPIREIVSPVVEVKQHTPVDLTAMVQPSPAPPAGIPQVPTININISQPPPPPPTAPVSQPPQAVASDEVEWGDMRLLELPHIDTPEEYELSFAEIADRKDDQKHPQRPATAGKQTVSVQTDEAARLQEQVQRAVQATANITQADVDNINRLVSAPALAKMIQQRQQKAIRDRERTNRLRAQRGLSPLPMGAEQIPLSPPAPAGGGKGKGKGKGKRRREGDGGPPEGGPPEGGSPGGGDGGAGEEKEDEGEPEPSRHDLSRDYNVKFAELEVVKRIACSKNPVVTAIREFFGCPPADQPDPAPPGIREGLASVEFKAGLDVRSRSRNHPA